MSKRVLVVDDSNLARRTVRLLRQERQPSGIRCVLQSDQPVPGLPLLLPDSFTRATVEGASAQVETRRLEGRERTLVTWDMPAASPISFALAGDG